MKTKAFTFSFLLMAAFCFSQQNYWTKINSPTKERLQPRYTTPKVFTTYQVDLEKLKSDLKTAPERFSKNESLKIKFPDSDGNSQEYIVQEASVMEKELQAKFPEMRSYLGWQKNNPNNTIRFSLTPKTGINIMYFDGWEVSYLDPYTENNTSFILYKRKDLPKNDRLFECGVEGKLSEINSNNSTAKAPLVSDGQFRTYRLALSATGEYTAFQGGTAANAMSAMVTTMTRVNGVYEKTISTTMVMVANNNLLIYTNSTTDPFTNGNPSSMITQNQTNTTTIIGSANYDIGHVFGTNSGGLAGLGVVCVSGSKARGVTGSGAPVGDPFDIDYVAHEMGHQFGGNHTFRAATSSCSGNANNSTAFEPGSGSTIMAYAGICGAANNVQNNSDAYFHAASVLEMYAVLQRSTDCSVKVSNNNGVPSADAGLDYSIPKGTAFVLTGVGTDPNNDPISYLWEQYDNTSNTQPPVSTATAGPVYSSLTPVASPSRYFPVLSSVVANNLFPTWEVTPSVARTLNFSLLVNDNKITGNQAARDAMVITVTDDGPFVVTSQPSNIPYNGTTPITVTWNVAGTNTGSINTQNVSILLSKDNGLNFNTVLAASVANNGTAIVNLPNENVASARIMVKALNNVFYALNPSNFSIVQTPLSTSETGTSEFSIYPNPAKEEFFIKLKNKSGNAVYSIYDMSGKLTKKGKIQGSVSIKTDGFTTGNYVVKIEMEHGEILTEKMIIKK